MRYTLFALSVLFLSVGPAAYAQSLPPAGAPVGDVYDEMAPYYNSATSGTMNWLKGDTLGAYIYGSQAQTILHGTQQGSGESASGRQQVPCSSVAALSGLGVILVGGQSNSANAAYADPNGNYYASSGPVYNLNIEDGNCYVAKEPLLGANGGRQGFALPLADQLIGAGYFRAVLLVPVGQGGTYIEQWIPSSNSLYNRFARAITDLTHLGLAPTFVLWHQGEGNAGEFINSDTPDGTPITLTPDLNSAGTLNWMRDFFSIAADLRDRGVTAPIFPAVATRCGSTATSSVIQAAQRNVLDPAWGIYPGPDTDAMAFSLRSPDGCHFSYNGNVAHAQAWYQALAAYLSKHPTPSAAYVAGTPSVSLLANGQRALVKPAGDYVVAWNSANVTACTLSWNLSAGSGSSAITPNAPGSGSTGALGTYTVECTGANGQRVSQTVTITSASAAVAPTCSITIPRSQVTIGGPFSISWSSQNATSLSYILKNSLGAVVFGPYATTTSGSISISAFSDMGPDTYTRTDTVRGPGGEGTCAGTFTVANTAATPSVLLSVDGSARATSNGNNLISWGSTGARACTLSWNLGGGTVGSTPIAPNTPGSGMTGSVGTYLFTCIDSAGILASKSATIDAPAGSTPPTVSLRIDGGASAPSNGHNVVSWNSSGASSCVLSWNIKGDTGSTALAANTAGSGTTGAVGAYALTCASGSGAVASKAILITPAVVSHGSENRRFFAAAAAILEPLVSPWRRFLYR